MALTILMIMADLDVAQPSFVTDLPPPTFAVVLSAPTLREHLLLFCLLGFGAHSHDHTRDRTGGRDLGAGPHDRLMLTLARGSKLHFLDNQRSVT